MRPTSPITRHNAQAKQVAIDRQRRHELRGQPSRYAGGGGTTGPTLIEVLDGGNDLVELNSVTYTGVKYPGAGNGATSVPVATPVAGTTYADGLGIGELPGGAKCWIASMVEIDSADVADTPISIPSGQYFYSRQSVSLPVAGGGGETATVYLIWTV